MRRLALMTISLLCLDVAGAWGAGHSEMTFFSNQPGQWNWGGAAAVDASGTKLVGSSIWYFDYGQATYWTTDNSAAVPLDFFQKPDLPWVIPYSYATGISRDGDVIVGWENGRAFRWTASGGLEALPSSARFPDWWEPAGVSDDGQTIVGSLQGDQRWHAVRWTSSGMVDLGPGYASAVSADGHITVGTDGERRVAVWHDGGVQHLWQTDRDGNVDVSADGSIVVGGNQLWTQERGLTQLGEDFQANAVSDDGQLVVGARVKIGQTFYEIGAEWRPSRGAQPLATVLARDYGIGDRFAGWELFPSDVTPLGNAIVGTARVGYEKSVAFVVHLVEPLPGDANFDDRVDLNDFGILKAHFGGGHWRDEGDFNRDFAVDLTDFGILKGNFGHAAPEPSSLVLALGLVSMVCCWRLMSHRRDA